MPTPRVIGIDDWSWRRGQRYGTIIVDLERNRPIDLLPDRHAETVAAWLKAHPEVEVVARGRAGAYADGIRAGAPNAVQVTDRWHLLRNLGDALAGVLDRHHHDLRMASKSVAEAAMEIGTAALPSPTTVPLPAPAAALPRTDRHGFRQARFDEVMALHGQGWPMERIARTLGVNRKTVRAWVRAGELPVWSQRDRGSAVDSHAVYLRQRWGEGRPNAARLWREIQERGFRGQLRTVQRWVRRLRGANPTSAGAVGTMGRKMPSKRRAAWLVVADPETIKAAEQRFVDALHVRSKGLTRVIELARAFGTMVRRQQADRLDDWLAAAKENRPG